MTLCNADRRIQRLFKSVPHPWKERILATSTYIGQCTHSGNDALFLTHLIGWFHRVLVEMFISLWLTFLARPFITFCISSLPSGAGWLGLTMWPLSIAHDTEGSQQIIPVLGKCHLHEHKLDCLNYAFLIHGLHRWDLNWVCTGRCRLSRAALVAYLRCCSL